MQQAAGRRFEILEILGEGSFGTVCVAHIHGDPLQRRVALKILKGTYATNQKILNRTRDEARLLSKLNHPNIVRVEGLSDLGGRPVLVMEHVEGVSVDQLLLRFKDGLPGSVALEVVRRTCLALHVAYNEALGHSGKPMRVIHRDIKPSNIILSIHGEVKLLDFGIAKGDFEGREADTQSVVMGSRPYMAPERLDGVSDSPSVDVYSAGMSLFELVTGRTMSLSINPVSHDQAMNRQLGYAQVEGMSDTGTEDLRDLIRRMCAYTREYRPTALEVARDLESLAYQIEPNYRVSLSEFSRSTVIPIYESRPRITPEEAIEAGSDGQFLSEVTAGLTISRTTSSGRTQNIPFAPYLFVGALGFVVMLLGSMAALKLLVSTPLNGAQTAVVHQQSGLVRVKIWIPSDAQAQVGNAFLPTPGHARVEPGPTQMTLWFNDGRELNCTFVASEGTTVRAVMDAGSYGLSVDDGEVGGCREVKAAPSGKNGSG